MSFWDAKKGFLLSPGDGTSCGGYILENSDLPRIRGVKIACEGMSIYVVLMVNDTKLRVAYQMAHI